MGSILDSSIVASAQRAGIRADRLIANIIESIGDQEAALSAVGYTELMHGHFRCVTEEQRLRSRIFLDTLTARLPIYPYTRAVAEIAGRIDAEQRSMRITIPTPDLYIGATALLLGYSVLTHNLRHFQLIPGLQVIPFV